MLALSWGRLSARTRQNESPGYVQLGIHAKYLALGIRSKTKLSILVPQLEHRGAESLSCRLCTLHHIADLQIGGP